MDFEAELLLVIKVDVSVASVFLEFFVIDGTGPAFVFAWQLDKRTGKFLSMIAFVFVEPSSTIDHFQVGFTDQVAVFRELAVESCVSSGVEGNIGGGGFSGWFWGLFGIDILIDLKGIIRGVGEKFFQAVCPCFDEWFERRERGFDIRSVGGEDVFIEECGAVGSGFHDSRLFGAPEVAHFGLAFGIFFSGNRFGSQRALGEPFDGSGFVKAVVDALFEVIFFDPGENFGGIGDGRPFQQVLCVQLVNGVLEEPFEVWLFDGVEFSS